VRFPSCVGHECSAVVEDVGSRVTRFKPGDIAVNVRRQNEGIDPVIELVRAGGIKPDFMVTHRFSLDQAAKAFELLADYRDGIIKAIVEVG
jgi:L-iditol 2-dehydrogenase